MSDAPKSLAQLCHLQDSALAFPPFLKKGRAASDLLCVVWWGTLSSQLPISTPLDMRTQASSQQYGAVIKAEYSRL